MLPSADLRALALRFGRAAEPVTRERRRLAEASRILAHAALASVDGAVPGDRTIRTDAWGRPRILGPGLDLGVSHDSGLLAVLVGEECCGVDVEDAPESALSEVARRFCGPGDGALLTGPGSARRLWTAKESAAKALGPGLRAGLATISFRSCPGQGWASVVWRGRPTALWTRSADCGGRHLSVTAARPAAVRVLHWEPVCADGRWRLRRAVDRPLARLHAANAVSASRTQPWGT